MKSYFVVGVLLVAAVAAVPTPDALQGDLDCMQHQDSLLSCFVVKANSIINRASRSLKIEIADGVAFTRTEPLERTGKALKSEVEVLNELPRDASDRTLKLVTMLYESAAAFFKTHKLQMDALEDGSFARSLVEGRGKMIKKFLPIIAGLGVKLLALVPIVLGGVALLTLKALFIGKIALLIAGILAFQKLFSGGGGYGGYGGIFGKNAQQFAGGNFLGGGSSGGEAQGWSGSQISQPQGYYKRSFDEASAAAAKDPQQMAYSAQVPAAAANEAN